jgi:ATP-dependent RNA helicase RhlE
MESVLIFSRTKHGADKIARRLARQGIASVAIHSNRTQPQRERALEGFREGKFRVLVATDIAARGIDVDGISHVINYDIPHYAEDYVHRIGRTGRAGAEGDAVTFVSPDDADHHRKIERYTGRQFPVKPYPGFTAKPAAAPQPQEQGARRHEGHERQSRQPLTSENPRHAARPAPRSPHGTGHPHRQGGPPRQGRPGQSPGHRGPGTPGANQPGGRKHAGHGGPQHPTRGKKTRRTERKTVFAVRKRKRGTDKKLDSFSSDFGGAAWSNY